MTAQAAHVQRINDLLNGVPGSGVPVRLTELRSATYPSLQVRNLQPNSTHLRVLASSTSVSATPLFEVSDAGIFSRGDVVPTVTSPDVFYNKKVNYLDFSLIEIPSAPPSAYVRLFARQSDGNIWGLNADGTLQEVVNQPVAPPEPGQTTIVNILGSSYVPIFLMAGV